MKTIRKEYTKKYYQEHKEYYKKHHKRYYQENKEKLKQLHKKYYQKNKEKIRRYKEVNKEKIIKQNKKYYQKNKEKIRRYREVNKKKIIKQNKKYYQQKKEKIKLKGKIYYKKNAEKIKQYNKKYQQRPEIKIRTKKYKKQYSQISEVRQKRNQNIKRRRKENPNFRISCLLRGRFIKALNLYTKNGKIKQSELYGIDYEAIINYLKPFPEDLSLYHIHHIKPLFTFNFINKNGTTNEEEILKAFSPQNHKLLLIEEHKKLNHNELANEIKNI